MFAADRAAKAAAVRFLSSVPTVPVLPGIFHLTLVRNTGVAFGLLRGHGLLVTGVTLVLLGWLTASAWKRGHLQDRKVPIGLGLIAGGAAGNLLDRVRFGAVIDFLDFRVWPVFNLADSCITIGALLMAWVLWRQR